MIEFIDILDEYGNIMGIKKERSLVHKDGDWHKVVQIFAINEDKILLQKRALTKKSEPGKWCATASGHIISGMSSYETAFKEFKEELGIELQEDKTKLINTFKSPSIVENNGIKIYNNHFVDLFITNQIINLNSIKLQKEEVSQIKFWNIEEFRQMVNNKDKNLINTPTLFKYVLDYIDKLKENDIDIT